MQSNTSTNSKESCEATLSFEEDQQPIRRLNGTYDLLKIVGTGSSCKVWLARSVANPRLHYAIKIMSSDYMSQKGSKQNVLKEVDILFKLDHEGVIQMYEYGENGVVQYGQKLHTDRTYIVMEYVKGPLLFDMAKQMGGVGEELGRYYAKQMIEQLEYLNSRNIVHRDIKLENILMDENMKLKLADFGFATDENIEQLRSYKGTQSYMAPEIRTGEVYNGTQTDIFSMGVVLFTLIVGYFPFSKASLGEQFYRLLVNGERDEEGINQAYWKTLKSSHFSWEFKDLMQKILSYEGKSRPTLEEIKEHPWYKGQMDGIEEEYSRRILKMGHSKGPKAKEWLRDFKDRIQSKETSQLRAFTAAKQSRKRQFQRIKLNGTKSMPESNKI